MSKPPSGQDIDFYKTIISEEHYFLDGHHACLKFFVGLVTTIMGGIVYGLFHADKHYEWLVLLLGSAFGITVSAIGIYATFRFYRRFLEAVAVRVKWEDEHGFRTSDQISDRKIWPGEPFVSRRHLETELYTSSADFINKKKYRGLQRATICVFSSAILVFLAMAWVCARMACVACSVSGING